MTREWPRLQCRNLTGRSLPYTSPILQPRRVIGWAGVTGRKVRISDIVRSISLRQGQLWSRHCGGAWIRRRPSSPSKKWRRCWTRWSRRQSAAANHDGQCDCIARGQRPSALSVSRASVLRHRASLKVPPPVRKAHTPLPQRVTSIPRTSRIAVTTSTFVRRI